MVRWRWIARIVNIAVAAALLSRLVIPSPGVLGVAHAASFAPTQDSGPGAAPAGQAAPPELAMLLNLLVRQAMLANGWSVVSLASQLNPAANEGSPSQQSGTGDWQIGLFDENQEPLALTGRLSYQVSAQAQGSIVSSAEITLRGELEGEAAALVLDLSSSMESDGRVRSSTGESSRRHAKGKRIRRAFAVPASRSPWRTTSRNPSSTARSTATVR